MVKNKSDRVLLLETDFYGPKSLARLCRANVKPIARECRTKEDLIHLLLSTRKSGKGYTAIFVRLGMEIGADVFSAGGGDLRWIVTPTTGLGHIDMTEAARRRIKVLSLKGETAFLKTISSTAELTWGLLLSLIRRIPTAHGDVLQGRWRRDPFQGRELAGKTLGIIGLGRLGVMVEGYGHAFGMKVIACDERDSVFANFSKTRVEQKCLDDLLLESDVVSLHLPLEERNIGFLNAKRMASMKPGAFFVNTSRGELVDETALLQALKEGTLAGAALDVLCEDSRWDRGVPEDHSLVKYARNHSNLLLTPHIGGYSSDAISKTRAYMVEKFCEQLDRMEKNI